MLANRSPPTQLLWLLGGLAGGGGQTVSSRRGGREQEAVTQWGGPGTTGAEAKVGPDAH